MSIPEKMPGLKWIIIIYIVTAVVWAVQEGDLGLTLLLGTLTSLIVVALFLRRTMANRKLSWWKWLMVAAFSGLMWGIGSAAFTLLFMAVKTGLHAHGPEYSAYEVNWVVQQIPLWGTAGLIAGVGIGLLARAVSNSTH